MMIVMMTIVILSMMMMIDDDVTMMTMRNFSLSPRIFQTSTVKNSMMMMMMNTTRTMMMANDYKDHDSFIFIDWILQNFQVDHYQNGPWLNVLIGMARDAGSDLAGL